MKPLEFTPLVHNGRIPDAVRKRIADAIGRFDGKRVRITVGHPKRSENQNDYWFAVLTKHALPVFREGGDNWSVFDVHEYVMIGCGYLEHRIAPGGKAFAVRQHSSDFDTDGWEEFMERGRAFLATEHGIALPHPNEEWEGAQNE